MANHDGVNYVPSALDAEGFSLALLDALPDATAVLDSSGTIVAVNLAWRMFALDNGGRPERPVSDSATTMRATALRPQDAPTRRRCSQVCAPCLPAKP
jgi:hypothetical protein